MRKLGKRALALGVVAGGLLVAIPWAGYLSLNVAPGFYRAARKVPRDQLKAEARRFVAQSLQLRNDIVNEPTWEAAFSDAEVNAWLAEELLEHFAELLPPEVHDPRVVFEADRVTLAFGLDQGPIRTVIWVVARVKVPSENVIALTLEKVRAGVVPLSAEGYLERVAHGARDRGLDVSWTEDGAATALIRLAEPGRVRDFVLERIVIRTGEIRLAGRSTRRSGRLAGPSLPDRRILQSTFPKWKTQRDSVPAPTPSPAPPAPPPVEQARSSARPTS